jgi:hypothetical protein
MFPDKLLQPPNTIMLLRSVIIKARILLSVLFCVTIPATAQTDSTQSMPRHHVSVNLFAGLAFGEVGGYYDYRISEVLSIQASYGHRFYDFHTYQRNIDVYTSRVYQAQQADIYRLDLKTYFSPHKGKRFSNSYLLYRLDYWETKARGYLQYYGFDKEDEHHVNGGVQSIQKKNAGVAIGLGSGFDFPNHICLDLNFVTGFTAGNKKITFPDNSYEYSPSLFLTFELGAKIGGWF